MGCLSREAHTNQLSSWTWGRVTQRWRETINSELQRKTVQKEEKWGRWEAGGNAERPSECLLNWRATREIRADSASRFN